MGAALRLAGRLLGTLRKIPFVDDAVDRFQRRFLNPVVTKLVTDPDDPDLDAALDLYRKRIPDDQRFEAADIVRWIREDRQSRASLGPTDWFVVAKFRRKVRGFILFHYYPSVQLGLFAYLVVANTPGPPVNAVSRSLTRQLPDFCGSGRNSGIVEDLYWRSRILEKKRVSANAMNAW